MWGNPTREIEIYYSSFRKVQYSSKYTFPAKGNTSQPQKTVPKILPWKMCPSLYSLLKICASKSMPNRVLYGLHSTAQQQEDLQKMPQFPCQRLP
jgi:hypothetical protein